MLATFNISPADRFVMGLPRSRFWDVLLHAFKYPYRAYSDLALKLVGTKNLLLKNEIRINANDIGGLDKIAKLLTVVDSALRENNKPYTAELKESISISLASITDIKAIVIEKHRYEKMKIGMFAASSQAISSNLNKYKESVYDNK